MRSHDEYSQAEPAIALAGVNLSLGQGAARVHILKDIDLHIGTGEAIGLVGPPAQENRPLLMVMAGLERAEPGRSPWPARTLSTARRGRAGPLSRAPCRHRLPVLPPDPDHDRAGERRRAARVGRRARRLRGARARRACRVGLGDASIIIRPSFRAASSSASRSRARSRPIRPSWLPTSRPANLDEDTGERSSICCLPATSSAAPRWCW